MVWIIDNSRVVLKFFTYGGSWVTNFPERHKLLLSLAMHSTSIVKSEEKKHKYFFFQIGCMKILTFMCCAGQTGMTNGKFKGLSGKVCLGQCKSIQTILRDAYLCCAYKLFIYSYNKVGTNTLFLALWLIFCLTELKK